jgi:hypothetical protein
LLPVLVDAANKNKQSFGFAGTTAEFGDGMMRARQKQRLRITDVAVLLELSTGVRVFS